MFKQNQLERVILQKSSKLYLDGIICTEIHLSPNDYERLKSDQNNLFTNVLNGCAGPILIFKSNNVQDFIVNKELTFTLSKPSMGFKDFKYD